MKRALVTAVVFCCAVLPATAAASIQTARSGNVVAVFSFQGSGATGFSHVHLRIARVGVVRYDAAVTSASCPTTCWPANGDKPSIHVLDLEHDGEPDVVLDLYSGGAHCCVIEQVFSFDPGAGTYRLTERNFSDTGATLEDLGHNGHFEFVSADDLFEYVFTDYGHSGTPLQVWSFAARRFTDVTGAYPDQIAADGKRWLELFRSDVSDGEGYIAAWAADEDRLGQEAQVAGTLADENRKGNLRSAERQVWPAGEQFIAKLNRFLRDHGYLVEPACSPIPPEQDEKLEIEGCFVPGPDGTYVSDRDVWVNGLKFAPASGGTVIVDAKRASLRITGAGAVLIGGLVPVWAWAGSPVDLPLKGTVTLINNKYGKIFGFPIVGGSLSATWGDGEITITGTASLRVLGDDVTASLSVIADNHGIAGATVSAMGAGEDPNFHELSSCSFKKPPPIGFECASVTNAKGNTYSGLVPKDPAIVQIGPIPVQDASFTYDSHKHEWAGEGEIALGDLLPGPKLIGKLLPTFGLGLKIGTAPFRFDGASASDSDLHLTIGPAVLKKISFELELHPDFKVSGEADIAATTGSIEVDGGFDYEAGENGGFKLKIKGTVTLETETMGGYIGYDSTGGGQKVTFGGTFDRSFGPASLSVSGMGGIGGGHFELDADASVSVFGQSASGHAVLSDAGVGACGHVSVLFFSGDIGFKHFWSGETDFNGCDFGGLHTFGSGGAHDAATGASVVLPAGVPRQEFAAAGASAPPAVTLTGPAGAELSTPSTPDRIAITPQGLALAVTSSKTTYFIVTKPAAGRWTLAPQGGVTPPVGYELADPIGSLGLGARVTGRGATRVLRWRFRAAPGVGVRFFQRGGTEQTITTTSRGRGRARFTVAAGPGGRRQVLALVSVDGIPRETITVATFGASSPRLPRVAHASYRVARGALSVSWTQVRGASFYDVEVALSGGVRARYRIAGSAAGAGIPIGRRARVRSVSVTVSAGGLTGRAVAARRGAARRG